MNIEKVPSAADHQFAIGGGAGYFADKVAGAVAHMQAALLAAKSDWSQQPIKGPHPREAALASVREAITHLNEALEVEAVEDAITSTRQALQELTATERALEGMPNAVPVAPGQIPVGKFEETISRLQDVEHRLRNETWGFG